MNHIKNLIFCNKNKFTNFVHTISTLKSNYGQRTRFLSIFLAPSQSGKNAIQLKKAIRKAEQIVEFPNLRCLNSEEIAELLSILRKIGDSKHPLLKTTKNCLFNDKNAMQQPYALIVQLFSKAAGYASAMGYNRNDEFLHSQLSLVEIIEMIRITSLIYHSLVNLHPSSEAGKDSSSYDSMAAFNKIGLLMGDYLFSQFNVEMANLRNPEIFQLLMTIVRDIAESEFIGDRDEQNNPLPSKPGTNTFKANCTNQTKEIEFDENDHLIPLNVASAMGIPEKEWECRNILNSGSLLGKSCQGALKLAGQSEEMQRQAYLFGKHLLLTWQACVDTDPFQGSTLPLDHTFSLVSAPVLFHLDYDPSIYAEIEKGRISVERVDYEKLHKAISAGPALEKTKELQRKHASAAIRVLENFPQSDARIALQNIILAM